MNTTKRRLKKSVSDFLLRTLIVGVITLVIMIVMKTNANFKTSFYKYVYDTNLSFDKFTNIYNKYFKDLHKVNEKSDSKVVSSSKYAYDKIEKYKDGAKLTVGSNYSVPIKESGLVVFKGNKDGYGNVIIIQQINGIDMWYANISDSKYKLYDYVKKGDILGISNDYLYVVFKKSGKVLNYEDYL